MSHYLEIDSVQKSFGHNSVLTDVYLRCETGDIVGLLGRNGSGKSTFMKILFGIISADQKFIRIDDKVFNSPYLTAGEIAYLPQDFFLPRNMRLETVANLYLSAKQSATFFKDFLLRKLRFSKVASLSGGEQRYVEIKLLLHSDAKFILLDEPFNGIAPVLITTIKEMVRQCAQNKGIILTDHDYHNVIDVANRHYLFADGGLKPIRNREDLVIRGYMSEERASELNFEARKMN